MNGSVIAGKPLRVVFLLEDLAFGGTQRQAVEMARRFDTARVRPSLWVLLQGDDFAPLAREWGLDVRWLTRRSVLGPAGLLTLWRRLRAERPDVLVLLTALPNIWGRIAGRLAGLPVIVGNIRQSGAPVRYHERWLKNLADHHVCNAAALRDLLVRDYGLPPERITVIHNGVDVERFRPRKETVPGVPVLLSAARLVSDKDQACMLRAFARVAENHSDVELHLYGDGPLRQALIEQAAAMPRDIGARVRIFEGRSGLEEVYPAARMFLLSSLREGLPNVILEAMASGLPVVATAVDGVPELVEHGRTGLLLPAGDWEAMAAGIERLLEDDAQCKAMGRAGRDKAVREFSYENATRAHEALFAALARPENTRASHA